MVYAGALLAEGADATTRRSTGCMRRRWHDLIWAAPFATVGTLLWIVIAYKFHQSMIDAVTGGQEVTRKEQPRLYNLLENLCISRGITDAEAQGHGRRRAQRLRHRLNEKQYSITVTHGLLDRLDDAEIEAVLGHELTHIRNGDVRMLVIAVIIAGVIAFFAELVFRLLFQGGWRWGGGRSSSSDSDRGKGGGGIVDRHRARADRGGLAPVARDPLRAVAQARIPRRCRLGRADQESRTP